MVLMTRDEIGEFRAWHEYRLIELRYPQAIKIELRRARERWLAGVKPESSPHPTTD